MRVDVKPPSLKEITVEQSAFYLLIIAARPKPIMVPPKDLKLGVYLNLTEKEAGKWWLGFSAEAVRKANNSPHLSVPATWFLASARKQPGRNKWSSSQRPSGFAAYSLSTE
jgi:hypothetical protein